MAGREMRCQKCGKDLVDAIEVAEREWRTLLRAKEMAKAEIF